jgi:curved DNA-binding protein CbpA
MRGAERLLLPRKIAGVEVASLPLSPVEAFVLSQLDGATEIAEVAIVTNLDEREVRRVIQRLEELGAIETGTESQRNPRSRRALDPRRDEGGPTVVEEHFRPSVVQKPLAVAPTPSPPTETFPPSEPPAEDIDINEERRAQIDDLHTRLDSLSHYQLLDIDPKADKKAIKEAYFRIIPVFHPDKYFGKRVGSYKKKLERVFERLTQAYEVLTRPQKRADYDTYLVTRRATRAFDAVLSSIPPPPPSEKPPPTPIVASVEPSERTTLPARSLSSIDPERRRRFADRLLSTKPAAPEAPAQKLPPDQALDGLRRLLAPRREAKAVQQIERFRIAGERAFEEGKWVSAVNALRIALSLVPEDDRLRQLLDDAENKAAAELAGSYLARANYEERNQNWEEAARSYQRVAAGRPNDHDPLEKAAQCLLRSSADPRQAVTLARRATQLAPKIASCRLTLARAYEAADLINSAMAELERARELSPKDPEITDWIARLKSAKR